MKKMIFILAFLLCLLLCSAAAADRNIPLSQGGIGMGSIDVPDNVTVIMEKDSSDGIVCTSYDSGVKTFSLVNYEVSQGGANGFASLAGAQAGQKVVIFEIEEKAMSANPSAGAATIPLPNLHTGVVRSAGEGTIILDAFVLEGTDHPGPDGELVSKEAWAEYESYLSDINIDYTVRRDPTNRDQNIKIHQENPDYEFDLYGNAELTFHVTTTKYTWWVHFKIDVDLDFRVDKLGVKSDTPDLKISIPLEEFCFPGSFEVSGKAKGAIAVTFEKSVGFTLEFDLGFCKPDFKTSSREETKKPEVFGEAGVGIFVGVAIGPEIELLEIIDLGIVYKMGYSFEYTHYFNHWFYDDDDHYRYHACSNCNYLNISPQLGPLCAEVSVVKVFSKEFDLIEEKKLGTIYDHYWSDTYHESGDGFCPHVAYMLNVIVKDQNKKAMQGADVSYAPYDEKYFKDVSHAVTNHDGEAVIYIPLTDDGKPNKVTVTAEAKLPDEPLMTVSKSVSVTEEGIKEEKQPPEPLNQEIDLDMTTLAIYFEDSGSGTASDMPPTVRYLKSTGKAVIPDNIPNKPGLLFTAWNTEKDGSGQTIAPGDTVGFAQDQTLYAQWELLTQNYIVQYNANGGSWAPDAQFVHIGQPCVLSNQPAVWENHHFLGWSRSDMSSEPEYPYGQVNELVNTNDEYIITLYAVWSFDPVLPPIRLHFDMNGGPQENAPSDQWMDAGTWYTLPTQKVWWDEIHVLQGWSKDKNAKQPDYYSARTYRFTEDTTLYAVWKQLPVCELSFEDPAGGDTANMPEIIIFVPDVSPKVNVPDTVPQKSGRHFTGWNTAADGSGYHVAPGTVLILHESTVLYAQWEVISTNWMVIFNANGGESAPRPQFAKTGEAMILTTEQPVWASHRFLGWSADADADMPEYPVGQTNAVPYDPDETALTLYAVWGFDPVDMPIHITFDLNGSPSGKKPDGQWIQAGSWITLPKDIIKWDGQHTFLGWSSDPKAKTPDFKAGEHACFDSDTVLYAVWKASYRITRGDGSVWKKTQKEGLRFVANGKLAYFEALQVDGRILDESRYTLTSGSTVADLHVSYLKTLSHGKHTIRFVYRDGTASGSFTISKVPHTGDSADPRLWLGLVLAGLAGAVLILILAKRKGRKE